MQNVTNLVKCANCGNVDLGNFCSECGENLHKANLILRILNKLAKPIIDYFELIKDVIVVEGLATKVKDRRFDLLKLFSSCGVSMAVVSILSFLTNQETLVTSGKPLVGDIIVCLIILIIGANFAITVHLFIDSKTAAITFVQAAMFASAMVCVTLPLILIGPISSVPFAALRVTALLALIINLWRGQQALYRVSFLRVLRAHGMSGLAGLFFSIIESIGRSI